MHSNWGVADRARKVRAKLVTAQITRKASTRGAGQSQRNQSKKSGCKCVWGSAKAGQKHAQKRTPACRSDRKSAGGKVQLQSFRLLATFKRVEGAQKRAKGGQ